MKIGDEMNQIFLSVICVVSLFWKSCFHNKNHLTKKTCFYRRRYFSYISLNIFQIIDNILLCIYNKILESWDTNIWIPVFQKMNKCFEIPTQLLKFNRSFINNPSFIWFWILRLLLINLGIIIFELNVWSDPKCIWFYVLKHAVA